MNSFRFCIGPRHMTVGSEVRHLQYGLSVVRYLITGGYMAIAPLTAEGKQLLVERTWVNCDSVVVKTDDLTMAEIETT